MDKKILNWILNQMDDEELQIICEKKKVKIPGFRTNQKYPRPVMIVNLLKNKNKLISYLKSIPGISEEKKKFQDKDIIEIETLIDINNKEKIIKQMICLLMQDKPECIDLAGRIFNKINDEDNLSDESIADKEEKEMQTEESLIQDMKKDDKIVNSKKSLDKYIVNIQEKNRYYNIYPLLKFENNELIEVKKEDYPDYGNVTVKPDLEFSKQNYDIKSSLWICKFNQSQLEEIESKIKSNSEIRTKYKINGDELIKNKSIYSINEDGIYQIVELLEDNIGVEKLIHDNNIQIKDEPISDKVFIKDSNYVYGPFGYKDNNLGGGYYLNKEENDYIIHKYPIEDNDKCLNIIEIYNQYDYRTSYVKAVYFFNKENLVRERLDIISNEELLDKLKQIINTKNTSYSRKEVQEIRKNIDAIVDNFLSEERINRIKNLIKNTEASDTFIENDLIEIMELLLESEENQNRIAEKILEKPENLRKLQNVEIVQSNIKKLNQELSDKKEELKQIQLAVKEANDKNKKELIENNQTDLKVITSKKEEMEKSIQELTKKYNLCSEIDKLFKEKDKIEKDAQKAKKEYDVFSSNSKEIQKEITTKLENITSMDKYSSVAFDGMIANEMLESAAKWSENKNKEIFEQNIASKENVSKYLKIKTFKGKEIIEYIYDNIKKYRDYSRNDVINIMICLTQEFLTVFAGEPGVGKTSICNIIAKVLGLSNKNINYNRFIEVSVEKGWTSKRDLIGYYNPLTKSFDKNNKSLFKAFNILHQEYNKGINDFSYYILLDEANLSSMEHYWADFMNVCDLDKENRKINLGEEYIYDIPQTLRFLATINYDHTTETLSPRLVDRAWIILLDQGNLETDDCDLYEYIDKDQQMNDSIIKFEDLKKCFSYSSYDNLDEEGTNSMYEELKKICEIFQENNIFISKRISNMIKRYLRVGCNLFEDTKDTPHEFVALDYAVAQKLLPKINGYGEEYENFLEKLEENFNSKNMMKCKVIISNILKNGNVNMKYYQFFS